MLQEDRAYYGHNLYQSIHCWSSIINLDISTTI